MAAVRYMRASGEDRQRNAGILRDAHVAGRLPPGEFCERLGRTFAAATWGEPDDLVAGLPVSGTGAGLPAGRTSPASGWRDAGWHPFRRALLTSVVALVLGLKIHVATAALLTGCLLAFLAVLLPLLSGRARAGAEHDAMRGR